jgi:hypothetical protein
MVIELEDLGTIEDGGPPPFIASAPPPIS